MFKWQFSMYGAACAILLLLLSFVVNWVIKPNFQNKYRNIKYSKILFKNATQIADEYMQINKKNVLFRICDKNNFWVTKINNEQIFIEKEEFYGDSVYSMQEVLFKVILLNKTKKVLLKSQIYIKVVIFLISILIYLSLVFSFWVGVILGFSFLFAMSIIEFVSKYKIVSSATKDVVWILTRKENEMKKILLKITRYKKFYFIKKYVDVFFQAWISLFIVFKKWGKSE